MRNHITTIPAILLLLGVAFGMPAATAGDCRDDSDGFGEETASCNFGCNANEFVNVMASVDDNGAIQGSASCGGAGADCRGTASCNGSSAPTVTRSGYAGAGNCSGTGNGGWWSSVMVYCWTQTAGAGAGAPGGGKVGVMATARASASPAPLLPDEVAQLGDSVAAIVVQGGVASGLVCNGGQCVPAIPLCEVVGEAWSCRL